VETRALRKRWHSFSCSLKEQTRWREDWRSFEGMLLRVLAEAEKRPFAHRLRDDLRTVRRSIERIGKRL
jgi:hypothetical protein